MKETRKKIDKRTLAVRVVCIALAALMVAGGVAYAVTLIFG